jgi:hypothetical protein
LAFFFLAAALLQERVQRHGEETRGKAEQDERKRRVAIGRRRPGHQGEAKAHQDRTERHQPELDVIAGEPAGGETAEADADGEKGGEQADVKLIEMEQLLAEGEDVDVHQRAKKPEIGNADDGQPKRAVGAQAAQAVENLAERIEAEQLDRAGGGNARNPKTGVIPGDGDGDHQQADQRQLVFPQLEDGAAQ